MSENIPKIIIDEDEKIHTHQKVYCNDIYNHLNPLLHNKGCAQGIARISQSLYAKKSEGDEGIFYNI